MEPVWIFLIYLFQSSECDQIERRLFPIKYDLTVTPYFESESDSRFEASLVFTFKPLRHNTVKKLALHADGLSVGSIVMLEINKNVTSRLEVTSDYDSEDQLLNVETGYPLSVDGTYELHVNYSGRIADDGWGLYKGSYDHEGKQRFYAVTQLRPVYARRLLPCLDEPSYKARFTLRVWRLPEYSARSNMPRIDTSPRNVLTGRVLDTFAETPPMSTFLLALAVFDFSSLTSADGRFCSWTVPAKIHLADHGQTMMPAVVKAMETVAGSKFPLPKMDQIALPQLNPVAMENWGMNTFREVFLLYKDGLFAPRVRQDVPRFTAHEVAHHWLGNLVTLQWWDWLWLSEMYAMYYEYYLPSQVEPSWRMADQMVVDLFIPGLLEDSLNTTRPLTTRVSTNQEILAKFSGVVYSKGPALVQMINHFVTPSRAEKALRTLLHEKKFGTVNPRELWEMYERKAEGLPADMQTIMSPWTDSPGYPLVTATVNHSHGSVTLQQERYLVEGSTTDSTKWWIPLTYTSGSRPNFTNTNTRIWLNPNDQQTTIRLGRSIDSWILFNIKHIGFYRVNYDPENWDRLIHSLHSEPSTIHELNRAQLLDDSFSLARAARVPYSLALRLASYLTHEGCYFPWAAVLPSITFLLTRLNGHPAYEPFRDYVKQLITPVYANEGFYLGESDSHLRQLHRVQIASLACSLGLPACVRDAQRQEELIGQGKPSVMAPGLEAVQLCTVLEAGLPVDNKFHPLTVWTEEDKVRAMPCAADKLVLISYLTQSLQNDSVTDWRSKLQAATTRLSNIEAVFILVIDHFDILMKRFGAKNVADYLNLVGRFLTTRTQLAKLRSIDVATSTEVGAAVSSLSASLVDRLDWIETHAPAIQSWTLSYLRNKTDQTVKPLAMC